VASTNDVSLAEWDRLNWRKQPLSFQGIGIVMPTSTLPLMTRMFGQGLVGESVRFRGVMWRQMLNATVRPPGI
jgi:hypothetical protein